MANPLSFSINSWHQGISDDDYIGAPGTFSYAQNLNIRSNPRSITLSAAPQVQLALTSTDGSPNVIINLDEFGGTATGMLVLTTQGKIYKNWTFGYQISSANKVILNATVFTIGGVEYLLIFRNGAIDRISTSDVQSGNWAGLTENWVTYSATVLTTYLPVLNKEQVCLIFGVANGLYVLDKIGTLTRASLLKGGEKIVGLTRTGDQLKVYSNRGDGSMAGTLHGYQYFYNINTVATTTIADNAATTYTVEWRNLPISGVANDGDIDYVVAGLNPAYSSLHISSGYQRVELKKKAEGSGYGQSKFNFQGTNNFMRARDGIVYIPSAEGIYTYGEYFPGFGKSINLDYADASINSSTFGSAFSPTSLYVGHSVNQGSISYWVSSIELQSKPSYGATTGTYYSRWITGDVVWATKSLKQINMGYSLKGVYSGTIQIYARRDEGEAFTLIGSVTDSNSVDVAETRKRIFPANLSWHEFFKLQIKLVLSKPNQDKAGPVVYDLTLNYDIAEL